VGAAKEGHRAGSGRRRSAALLSLLRMSSSLEPTTMGSAVSTELRGHGHGQARRRPPRAVTFHPETLKLDQVLARACPAAAAHQHA
jgi:hypothetical protein